MCVEPLLVQFGVPSRRLSRGLGQVTLAEGSVTNPLCRDAISRSLAYKERMLLIRKQTHCVSSIAVPYTLLSAEVKRLLRYTLYSLPTRPC